MILSRDTLEQIGAFTGAPVEKQITWKQGDKELTATVYVRPLSYRSTAADIEAMRGSHEHLAGRIASCICDENGEPVMSAADITGEADPERGPLDGNLTMALLAVIAEVNGAGKTKS